jgi:cellulose synthase/poly-beta-1,6-N-acetylglucosamine synthase-like glycosyltransferase
MSHIIQIILSIAGWIFFIPVALATLYIFVFALAGLFYRQKPYKTAVSFRKIAVLIPGYKEDAVILEAATDALKQHYPEEKYDVVVIADSFGEHTIAKLKTMPVKLIEVSFEKSTKAKALNTAMSRLTDDYDLAVVLDADNLMAPDFLQKINAAFENKVMAVQGHRTAKNMDTSLAILDAVSEEINNHIFRKGHRVLGLSSAIIGSGMAFNYTYFKHLMATAHAVGGFDKEIELNMLKSGYTIDYLNDALVFDEKVQKSEVFTNQRRRWLSAQLHYFRTDMGTATKHLITRGNVDYFDKAIQFIQPPRVLLLAATFCFTLLAVLTQLTGSRPGPDLVAWLTLTAACVLAFVFSIPASFYNAKTLRAAMSLPKGIMLMAGSLLRIKGANKQFIHTQHSHVSASAKAND